MNATLSETRARNRSISSFHKTTLTPAPQDFFATTPMQAIWYENDWQREEEAYTSFEAAISKRVLALKERRVSAYLETTAHGSIPSVVNRSAVNRLVKMAFTTCHKACSREIWKRSLLPFGAAMMLMLIGFDLMGLLVLYAR